MSLDNKARDVIGIDTLADNTILAESPDDYEKCFVTNEFIDLNEVTDTDMGLYF